ncbi:MAG TPA: TetR/AcrR family transcriptional regulator [Planctomycetota bacterium]|nr:TetR/AcrR family transcriptional regulator [Planctomycetota bacterium]
MSDATADRILDVATRLVQARGYTGFSYADIAEAVGIRKASIHHHFPAKSDLGRALLARYRERFLGALAEIERSTAEPLERLRRYAALYVGVLRDDDRMCLCGMMAADLCALEPPLRDEVRRFFDDNESWIAGVLEEGRRARTLSFDGPSAGVAALVLACLQGAMLVARSYGDVGRFEAAARRLLDGLVGNRAARSRGRGRPTHPPRGKARRRGAALPRLDAR